MTDIGRRGKGNSKPGTKGGSSRPGLQESLEELTRLADDLVDSLSDEETADQAPAEHAAAEEIFLDLDDNSEEAANVAIEEPAAEAPEEFEVVEPSEQPPVAAACKSEVPAVDDGAALQETLEELDLIGQQEPPVVQRFEVEFAGDKGADIDAHLDTLFGSEPSEPAPEPPTAVAVESAELSFEDLTEDEAEAAPVEQVAVAPESRDQPEQEVVPESAPSIFDEIEDPPRPAADTTDFHVAFEGKEPAVETAMVSREAPRSKKWLAVAAVVVVVATVGAWMFFSRTSSDTAPAARPWSQQASLVRPEPVASTAVEPVVSEVQPPAAVASEPEVPVAPPAEKPTPPPVKVAAPVKKPTPPPVKVAAPVEKPTPPPVKVAAPVEKPTPPPVKVAAPVEKPTPPPVKVAALVEKPTPPPVKVAAPVEKPTPPPVKVVPPVETAAPIEVAALVDIPAPAPVETEPAAPPMRVEPPEVLTRTEPVLTKKMRGERGTVALKVLVNESGRVVRVLVDEGIPGSPLEAAAIDAVLRWKYRPGTENGSPARAWVTETFVFEP